MAGKSQVVRDPEAKISLFDPDPFLFYTIKYGEILGVDALISVASKDRTISYN